MPEDIVIVKVNTQYKLHADSLKHEEANPYRLALDTGTFHLAVCLQMWYSRTPQPCSNGGYKVPNATPWMIGIRDPRPHISCVLFERIVAMACSRRKTPLLLMSSPRQVTPYSRRFFS
jgi:hypothetical protein